MITNAGDVWFEQHRATINGTDRTLDTLDAHVVDLESVSHLDEPAMTCDVVDCDQPVAWRCWFVHPATWHGSGHGWVMACNIHMHALHDRPRATITCAQCEATGPYLRSDPA